MSDALFPTLAGIKWDRSKNPEFRTISQSSANGKETDACLWSYPKWHFSLSYEFLRDDGTASGELQQLIGFFLARRGNFDTFLYLDPSDNHVNNQVIAIGDGATKTFQLVRSYAGFVEPVFGVLTDPGLTVSGQQQSYTWDTWGAVTFSAAPPYGAQILAPSFNYCYRVKFVDSMMAFNNFLYKLWDAKTVEFASYKK